VNSTRISKHLPRNLVDLSTVAVLKNSNRSWVKIQSAPWVNIQSALTAEQHQQEMDDANTRLEGGAKPVYYPI
jgi:hypothetical protein